MKTFSQLLGLSNKEQLKEGSVRDVVDSLAQQKDWGDDVVRDLLTKLKKGDGENGIAPYDIDDPTFQDKVVEGTKEWDDFVKALGLSYKKLNRKTFGQSGEDDWEPDLLSLGKVRASGGNFGKGGKSLTMLDMAQNRDTVDHEVIGTAYGIDARSSQDWYKKALWKIAQNAIEMYRDNPTEAEAEWYAEYDAMEPKEKEKIWTILCEDTDFLKVVEKHLAERYAEKMAPIITRCLNKTLSPAGATKFMKEYTRDYGSSLDTKNKYANFVMFMNYVQRMAYPPDSLDMEHNEKIRKAYDMALETYSIKEWSEDYVYTLLHDEKGKYRENHKELGKALSKFVDVESDARGASKGIEGEMDYGEDLTEDVANILKNYSPEEISELDHNLQGDTEASASEKYPEEDMDDLKARKMQGEDLDIAVGMGNNRGYFPISNHIKNGKQKRGFVNYWGSSLTSGAVAKKFYRDLLAAQILEKYPDQDISWTQAKEIASQMKSEDVGGEMSKTDKKGGAVRGTPKWKYTDVKDAKWTVPESKQNSMRSRLMEIADLE